MIDDISLYQSDLALNTFHKSIPGGGTTASNPGTATSSKNTGATSVSSAKSGTSNPAATGSDNGTTESAGDDNVSQSDQPETPAASDLKQMIKGKYGDVSIDYENLVITLNQKVTVAELLESFKLDGAEITLADKDGDDITNNTNAVIVGTEALKLIKDREEICSFTIKVNYDVTESGGTRTEKTNGSFPWLIVIIVAVVSILVCAGTLILVCFLVIAKKIKGGQTKAE